MFRVAWKLRVCITSLGLLGGSVYFQPNYDLILGSCLRVIWMFNVMIAHVPYTLNPKPLNQGQGLGVLAQRLLSTSMFFYILEISNIWFRFVPETQKYGLFGYFERFRAIILLVLGSRYPLYRYLGPFGLGGSG